MMRKSRKNLIIVLIILLLFFISTHALAYTYTAVFGGAGPGAGVYSWGQPLSTGFSAVTSKWNQPRDVRVGTNPHRGVDIVADMSTDVYAVCNGWVFTQAGTSLVFACDRNSDFVSNDNLKVVYNHLKMVGFIASSTTYVTRGTKIAESGDENGAYDPHLHFGAKTVQSATNKEVWVRNEVYYRAIATWNYGKDTDFISRVNWNKGSVLTASIYTMDDGIAKNVKDVIVYHRLNGTSSWRNASMVKSGSLKTSVFTFNLSPTYSKGKVINVMIRAVRPDIVGYYNDAYFAPKWSQPSENPNSVPQKYDYYTCTIGGSCSAN